MSVAAYHLLIKNQESRNPVSRRTGQPTNQTKAEAIEELKTYQAKATPANFQALCEERSDCGSFAQGGDLGTFERGAMQKPFEDATFALEVGQISGIVETDSGVHLILRYA